MPTPVIEDKIRLRAELKARRNGFAVAYRDHAQAEIGRRLMALIYDSPAIKTVATFWPVGSEVDLTATMATLREDGYKVALPRVRDMDQPMEFRLWDGTPPTEASVGAVLQPGAEARMASPDLILVPLLGFDRLGNRLGYGKGFYDRTLREMRIIKPVITVGIAFAEQEVPRIPTEKHDQRLDWILTDRGAIHTTRTFG